MQNLTNRAGLCTALLLCGFAVGCGDVAGPTPAAANDAVPSKIAVPRLRTTDSIGRALHDVVPQYPPDASYAGSRLVQLVVHASADFAPSGQAHGYGYAFFFGNYGDMTTNLTLYHDGAQIATAPPSKEGSFSYIMPIAHEGSSKVQINNSLTCDVNSTAAVNATVELRLIPNLGVSWLTVDSDTKSDYADGYTQDCPPPPPDLGGAGDYGADEPSERWYMCYYADYYNDDEFLFEESLGCVALPPPAGGDMW